MQKWINSVLANFGYIRVKLPLPPGFKALDFTERDLTKSTILRTLLNEATAQSSVNAEFLNDVSHKILADLEKVKSMSLHDQIRESQPDILAERLITYVLACGVACHWEMDVKIFAEKLGIKVFSDELYKNQKSPGFRRLEDIVGDIKKKVPKLEMNLARTMGLRDALIHGNFHQLRTYASESQKKSTKESFKGRVWKVDLKTNSIPRDMNEIYELEEIKTQGIFAWFLSTATSELFETVILEIKERIKDLDLIIELHALSFGETAWVFKQICLEGKKLSKEEVDRFINTRNSFNSTKKVESYLVDRIQSLIKR